MNKFNMRGLILVIFVVLIACTENKDRSVDKSSNRKISTQLRSIMINKTQCVLHGNSIEGKAPDLIGAWRDTLIWKQQKDDTCFYGIYEIDIRTELRIYPDKTFSWIETSENQIFNKFIEGEYFLFKDSITLARNPKGREVFNQGDTMSAVTFQIKWVDDDRVILVSEIKKRSGEILGEGTELLRTSRTIPEDTMKVGDRNIVELTHINDTVSYLIKSNFDGVCEVSYLNVYVNRQLKYSMKVRELCDHDNSLTKQKFIDFRFWKSSNSLCLYNVTIFADSSTLSARGVFRDGYNFIDAKKTYDSTSTLYQINANGELLQIER